MFSHPCFRSTCISVGTDTPSESWPCDLCWVVARGTRYDVRALGTGRTLSCSSWWSVVGNSGRTLGVSNGVTITCRPFGLETLFSDLLLTGFQLETPHTWSLGNLLGKFRHFKVGLIACRSGMHVPPIQGTCTHVRSLNTPSPASNLNSSVINDPLSVFASLERAHVQWGT